MNAKVTISTAILLTVTFCEANDSKWEDSYVSIYGGWGATDSGTIEGAATDYEYVSTIIIPVYQELGTYNIHNRFESDNSFLVGIRAGAWLRRDVDQWSERPHDEYSGWGAAFDVSYFKIDSESSDTTMHIVPASFLMLYRHPLQVSEGFPFGRIQPYGGIGFALVVSRISTPLTHYYYNGPTTIATLGYGGSIHAGCTWKLNQHMGFFIEYRYLVAKLEWEIDEGRNTHYYATEGEIDTSVSTHQLLAGVSFSL